MPQYVTFALPDVGEGLTEADIVEWKVAAGDRVQVNQDIVEIETAKSLVDLPCPYTGVVSELLVEVGQTVEVGAAIIVIDTDPDGEAASDDGGAQEGSAAPGDDAGASRGVGEAIDPAAAPGEGTGTNAGAGEDAASGQGAGQDTDSDRPDASGTEEPSGDVLVGYGTKGVRTRRRRRATPTPATPSTPTPPTPARPVKRDETGRAPDRSQGRSAGFTGASAGLTGPSAAGGEQTGRVLAKPPVRKLAKDLGIDLARVPGTGPGGIITREDVVAAQAQEEARSLATYPGDDQPWLDGSTVSEDGRQSRVPVRSVRRRTAEAMVTSAFTAPHVTVFTTVDVTKTMKLVERLRSDAEFDGVRVTPLLIAAKALILAIQRNPAISAAWDEQAQEIVYKHYINLGIAAATPRGLVVPNIKDAHRMNLHELAVAIGDLTGTARAGKTTPQAMSDGTVTITNVGVFGIDTGTPILNPGESAILAFGAIGQRPWVHKGKLKARWVTQLALSFDHRLVDGELGSRVLADVARVMADPTQGLVWG
ncbi:dihydrolipoamide acetyltransferase family protein [Pseudactinotalea sp. Z1748]|uniref:dihydrolipoamide acetyltransferase family protein n=1 Tax=Pseudactinotalea sp. Z1748 TaxID=3413027 RepID=UPI003C7A3BA7